MVCMYVHVQYITMCECNEQKCMTIYTSTYTSQKVVLFTSDSRAVDDVHCLSEVLVVGVHLLQLPGVSLLGLLHLAQQLCVCGQQTVVTLLQHACQLLHLGKALTLCLEDSIPGSLFLQVCVLLLQTLYVQ